MMLLLLLLLDESRLVLVQLLKEEERDKRAEGMRDGPSISWCTMVATRRNVVRNQFWI